MNGYNSDSSLPLSSEQVRDIASSSHVLNDSVLGFGSSLHDDWSPAPIEVLISDEHEEAIEKRTFNSRFVLIGRSPDCDISLDDERISFRHAYIQKIFGRLICVDLASRTGTHWPDGKRPFGWIDEQHPIAVGGFRLRVSPSFHDDDQDASDEPEFDAGSFFSNVAEQSILPNVSLKYLSRSSRSESWSLSRPITLVGSSSCCKLRLKHESVSRVHCSLNLMPDGLWVVDLLGKQGTLLDGEPIRSAQIPDGSKLTIGKYQFQVNYAPAEEATDKAPNSQLSLPTNKGLVSEQFVTQLVDQITNMQQQFVKQSQQQTEMMLKFFGTMHATQHELLRDEMGRVREIEREMRDLRSVIEKSQPISRAKNSDPFSPKSRQDANSATTDTQQSDTDVKAEAEPYSAEAQQPDSESASPSASLEIGSDATAPGQFETEHEPSSVSDNPNGEVQRDFVSPSEIAPAEESQTDHSNEKADGPADIAEEEPLHATEADHTWVLDRMYQLEREKEGILRKMMRSVFRAGS